MVQSMGQISCFFLIFFLVTLLSCGVQDVVSQPSESRTSPIKVEADGDVPWPLNTTTKSNDTIPVVSPTESNTHDEETTETDVQDNVNTVTIEEFDSSTSSKTPNTDNLTTESSADTSDSTTAPDKGSSTTFVSMTTTDISSTPTPTYPHENVTTTEKEIDSTTEEAFVPVEEGGFATWGVVVVALLISFAIILTALSFLRRYLIRRRREDQRKLLQNSASSEGFFYGDGSGSIHSARFHDSI